MQESNRVQLGLSARVLLTSPTCATLELTDASGQVLRMSNVPVVVSESYSRECQATAASPWTPVPSSQAEQQTLLDNSSWCNPSSATMSSSDMVLPPSAPSCELSAFQTPETSHLPSSHAATSCAESQACDDAQHGSRRVVLSLLSSHTDAIEHLQMAIVAIDTIHHVQVEGISPLYHVSAIVGNEGYAAVVQITSAISVDQLQVCLNEVTDMMAAYIDSDNVAASWKLSIVAVDGISYQSADANHTADSNSVSNSVATSIIAHNAANNKVSDSNLIANSAEHSTGRTTITECLGLTATMSNSAAALAPWLDMDEQATLDADPLAFWLVMTPDAYRVGKYRDDWIMGVSQ